MDEVPLILIAGLELWLVAVTVKLISRHFRFVDAKRKRKLVNLCRIREWMDAYLALLNCQYPEMWEVAFAHLSLVPDHPDQTASKRVNDALKEYRRISGEFQDAERLGYEALESLDDEKWYDRFAYALVAIIGLLPFLRYVRPWNFVAAVRPYLHELTKQRIKIFNEFPERFAARIDWDKLDYIDPAETLSIIHTHLQFKDKAHLSGEAFKDYSEREIVIADARDKLKFFKQDARRAINSVVEEIRTREEKWLLPYGNGE